MKFEQTKRRRSVGAKTSVDMTDEQIQFFDDNPAFTKKTVWDLGAYLAFAFTNNIEAISLVIGDTYYTVTIKEDK